MLTWDAGAGMSSVSEIAGRAGSAAGRNATAWALNGSGTTTVSAELPDRGVAMAGAVTSAGLAAGLVGAGSGGATASRTVRIAR